MTMFDLKGGSSNGWNYSDPEKPGYMEMIEGTVVEISNPQALDFNTKKPRFWDDGNPMRNLCVTIKGKSGRELNWVFAPKSKAAEACLAALDPDGTRDQVNIEELLGKMVRVQTQAGVYNAKNPRPWWLTVIGEGDAASVRGVKDLSQQAAPAPQPAPAPSPIAHAQAQAAQALGFQAAPQPVPAQGEDPTGGYYDQDIPF